MNKLSVIRIVAFSNKNYAIHIPLSSWEVFLNGKVLELKGAGSKVRYDLSNDLMCIFVTGKVEETAVGKTVKRMAVTGIASSLLSQGKGVGGAMMDLAVRGAETRIIVSARMVMKDTTTIDFEATEGEYRQFVSGLPANATTSQAKSRAEELISLVDRMSLDGHRSLPEIDGRIEAFIERRRLAEKLIIDGGSFEDRDVARQEVESLGNEIEYLQQLKKAVMYRLSTPEAMKNPGGSFLKRAMISGLVLSGGIFVVGVMSGGNSDDKNAPENSQANIASASMSGNAQDASSGIQPEAIPPKARQDSGVPVVNVETRGEPVSGPLIQGSAGKASDAATEKFVKPGFDCIGAATNAERMICASPELSAADAQLSDLYGRVLAASKNRDKLKADQINWIRTQRNVCSDVPCMLDVYEARKKQLMQIQ